MFVRSEDAARDLLLAAAGGREVIVRWFNWRTFSPEKRADSAINDYANSLHIGVQELLREGASEGQASDWQSGFVKRWLAYQHAGSRTMNWMITGPARFPVERNNKRMETEHKRGEELGEYIENRIAWLRRKTRSAERALASEAAKVSGETFHEMSIDGVRLVHNTAIGRVQLLFDGKPDAETIADLKGRAFRWSPREKAWQRQLTRNGIWAAQGILAIISERRAA